MPDERVLTTFHPLVRAWFEDTYGEPTDVQRQSWPVIAGRHHALITAPTGSGKTLTAFLWALNRFATGDLETGATRVLYVSPLKALNTDIAHNLLSPLDALRERFVAAGEEFPAVRVATRSGDTPADERTRMLRRPPEILITTPESLLLLLTTPRGRQSFASLDTVVMDEVHALIDSRRGVVLSAMVERLVELSGEVQRIALSATVQPLELVARWVGGQTPSGPRDVTIVRSNDQKTIELDVEFPATARDAVLNGASLWEPLAASFKRRIADNATTLIFTNSRRLAEKITHAVNVGEDEPLVYAHHGSLARDIRTEVEHRLKEGRLRAIVATSSLEMGIDIGHLDEVVLVQSPPTIASTLQRIGRAGHRVGETSHGRLVPTHARDFVEAAALATAVAQRDIEPLQPIENALDVLSQIIVAFAATETWQVDDLHALFLRTYPYHALARRQFDLVIEMLAGRYAGSRIRDLKPRLAYDRETGTVRANRGAVLALYTSGGTIPNRGYFQLRHNDSGAQIGELDEEYVWEATIGQMFSLGTQVWRIEKITHNDVFVRQAPRGMNAPPFWKAESRSRSFHYSQRIGDFLEQADEVLDSAPRGALQKRLVAEHRFDAAAAEELTDYLKRQREASGVSLPHRHHLVVEHMTTGPGGYKGPDDENQVILHTGWGSRVNRPFALALGVAWAERFESVPEIHSDNEVIAVRLEEERDPPRLLDLVTSANLEPLLRRALEDSGFFGARFRECAGRALLLSRQKFNQRLPLWMSRLQAKKLMTAIKRYPDFPVLLETWRTCLRDEFDLPALEQLLEELERGEIGVSFVTTRAPTPFAVNITFGQLNRYMYADDTPEREGRSALSEDLIRNATFDATLRPKLDAAVIAAFEQKRQRTVAGYRPDSEEELAEYLKERVLVPVDEWHAANWQPAEPAAAVELRTPDGRRWLVHREVASLVSRLLFAVAAPAGLPDVDDGRDAPQLIHEALSWYGPRTETELVHLFPLPADDLRATLRALADEDELIEGHLIDAAIIHHCDAENVEVILRMQRAAQRPRVEPVPVQKLFPFFARWQRFGRSTDATAIAESVGRLRGFTASVETWLDDLLAARHPGIEPHHLDLALTTDEMTWTGAGREAITFVAPHELDLVEPFGERTGIAETFVDPHARYSFFQLADAANVPAIEFNARLWEAVWAGEITSDGTAALRQGLMRNFELAPQGTDVATRTENPGFRRRARRIASGWPGTWHIVHREVADSDPLTDLERTKDRARVLLDRYGVICRELANREGGPFRWSALFKALRVMELSGEIVSGLFVEGFSGPHFAVARALRTLNEADRETGFWCSALDPVSPAALGVELPGIALPARRAGNFVAFFGSSLVCVAEANGKRLTFADPLPEPATQTCVDLVSHILRSRAAGHGARVESIDGKPPDASVHLQWLAAAFDVVRDHRGLELRLGSSPAR